MARTTVKFCMCTLVILFHLCSTSAGSPPDLHPRRTIQPPLSAPNQLRMLAMFESLDCLLVDEHQPLGLWKDGRGWVPKTKPGYLAPSARSVPNPCCDLADQSAEFAPTCPRESGAREASKHPVNWYPACFHGLDRSVTRLWDDVLELAAEPPAEVHTRSAVGLDVLFSQVVDYSVEIQQLVYRKLTQVEINTLVVQHLSTAVVQWNQAQQMLARIVDQGGNMVDNHGYQFLVTAARLIPTSAEDLAGEERGQRNRVPAQQASQSKQWIDPLNSDSDAPLESETDLETQLPTFQLDGQLQDPYWQYYDDCDRWGVNFAKLMSEIHVLQVSDVPRVELVSRPIESLASTKSKRDSFAWYKFADVTGWTGVPTSEMHQGVETMQKWLAAIEFQWIETQNIRVVAPGSGRIQLQDFRFRLANQIETVANCMHRIAATIRASDLDKSNLADADKSKTTRLQ